MRDLEQILLRMFEALDVEECRLSSTNEQNKTRPKTVEVKRASRKKRVSKRRWKARCRLGKLIPLIAIVEHQLDRYFTFEPYSINAEFYTAKRR